MIKHIAAGCSGVLVAVLAAGGLLGGLVVAASPAYATGGSLYASPAGSGAQSCADAADACTLQTALSDATAGDTVYLVQPGTEGTASSYYIGNWDVNTSGTSASEQVTIEPGPGVTSPPILDGDGTSAGTCETTSCDDAVLTIYPGAYATVEGISIQDADNTTTVFGGCIYNGAGATLSVTDSTFTSNSADDGGAINNSAGGTLTVSESTFTGNSATGNGGAIDNGDERGDTLRVTDSTFTGNSAARL